MLTQVQETSVKTMVPGADLTNLTDDQVRAIQAVLVSGSDAEMRKRLHAILADQSMPDAMLTANERSEIQTIVPGADLSVLTQAQVNALKVTLYGGSDMDQREHIRAIVEDSMVMDASLTENQRSEVMTLVPNADLAGLTDEQVVAIQLTLHSGSDGEARRQIRSILQ